MTQHKFNCNYFVITSSNIISKAIHWNLFLSSDIIEIFSFPQHSLVTSKISKLTESSCFKLECKANKGIIFAPFWVQCHPLCFLPATSMINAICNLYTHIYSLHQTNKAVFFNTQGWQTIQHCQVLRVSYTTNFSLWILLSKSNYRKMLTLCLCWDHIK